METIVLICDIWDILLKNSSVTFQVASEELKKTTHI